MHPRRPPRRPRPARRGLSLPELLVVTALVGGLGAWSAARMSEVVGPDAGATREVCAVNKRNLSGLLEVWQMNHPEAGEALSLPEGYPTLLADGLLRQVPFEPGTAGWDHTYRTTPAGNVVCRVHDLRHGHRPDQDLARVRRWMSGSAPLWLGFWALLALGLRRAERRRLEQRVEEALADEAWAGVAVEPWEVDRG